MEQETNKRSQPEKLLAWAIKDADNTIVFIAFAPTRLDATEEFISGTMTETNWRGHLAKGYSISRVKIIEVNRFKKENK